MKRLAKSALAAGARTGVGGRMLRGVLASDPELARSALNELLLRDPELATASLYERIVRPASFAEVRTWPASAEGFEDLDFLFSSNLFNMGVALLALDEAAYLYRLVRDLRPATTVEIGRFKGGGTFLLAAAIGGEGDLVSYDVHAAHAVGGDRAGPELDALLAGALARYGLADRVELVVGDSHAVPTRPCDVLFVDGDHRYPGVRADYEHWRGSLRPGGHVLFHDAARTRPFANVEEDVSRLVAEIERDDGRYFARCGGAGAVVDLVRTEEPAPWQAAEAVVQ